mmetsp:Transcript_7947/g.20048  ORF Transcript_7947/g.20048 Transcript_7947/m.20048 type:complete len:220 (+) Transcript_7947:386-1045(+)
MSNLKYCMRPEPSWYSGMLSVQLITWVILFRSKMLRFAAAVWFPTKKVPPVSGFRHSGSSALYMPPAPLPGSKPRRAQSFRASSSKSKPLPPSALAPSSRPGRPLRIAGPAEWPARCGPWAPAAAVAEEATAPTPGYLPRPSSKSCKQSGCPPPAPPAPPAPPPGTNGPPAPVPATAVGVAMPAAGPLLFCRGPPEGARRAADGNSLEASLSSGTTDGL